MVPLGDMTEDPLSLGNVLLARGLRRGCSTMEAVMSEFFKLRKSDSGRLEYTITRQLGSI